MGQFSVTIYGATGSVLNDIQHSGVVNSRSADEAAVRVTNSIVRFGNDNANDFLANMEPAQKEKIMAMTRSQARLSTPH
ncbi:hypothetical protein [Roseobacter sp. GAI101]|uniref:hypothetical protein n=1 Tax=Roseobacter sp. (strain GAI101) TaxID=391589 RepID=UPI0018DD6FF4|nr:hypothetical protein [Roseobacter sp. GAI101]